MKYGKHKLAPHISPKKSWEGAIAGTVFATIIASSFALFYGSVFYPGTWIGIL
jgi:phosphatidate cytidylyltransferase